MKSNKTRSANQPSSRIASPSPNQPEFWVRQAQVQLAEGHPGAALKSLQQACNLAPDDPDLNYNLGLLLFQTGERKQARQQFLKALHLNPRHLPSLQTLGNILNLADDPGAARFYLRGLQLAPHDPGLLTGLAVLLWKQGELTRSTELFKTASTHTSKNADILCNLGNVYLDQGEVKPAIRSFKEATEKEPGHRVACSNYLLALHYDPTLSPEFIFNEHKRLAPRFSTPDWHKKDYKHSRGQNTLAQGGLPGGKLKIGFISPDFKDHSVAHFVTPLLEHLDKKQVITIAYSDVQQPDQITLRIKKACSLWRDSATWTDQKLLQVIIQDQIDILIDLTGHTRGNRLSVFAAKPAPVQVTWLGYPNTTGLQNIDFRLVDNITDPPGKSDHLHTEQLYRLPRIFLSYDPLCNYPDLASADNTGQPFCFGSFNPLAKLNDQVLELWAKILLQVPEACLLLKTGRRLDEPSKDEFLRRLSQHGLERDRVTLLDRTRDKLAHLRLYQQMDMALDPFPYNGTTTTCEALLMGVPVLSLKGERHCARVGATILKAASLEHFLAKDREEYIRIACQVARQGSSLRRKEKIRRCFVRSGLFQHQAFAQEMESFFQEARQKSGFLQGHKS